MAKRTPRAGSFLFDVDAFSLDPAVLQMPFQARGIYIMLLCRLWRMARPGVAPDDDAVLCQLAGCTPSEWSESRPHLIRAFDTESETGFWTQRRMVDTKAEQDMAILESRESGRRGGNKRVANEKRRPRVPQGTLHVIGKGPSTASASVLASASGSVLAEEKDTQLSALASGDGRRRISRKALENGEALPEGEISADQAFAEIFYPEYPRKKDREDAFKAWKSLKLRDDDEDTIRDIMVALRRDMKDEWRDRPMDKIPYPAHWLRKKGWLDGQA